MSCTITGGRNRACKDNISGISMVYLFPFVSYYPYEMDVTRGVELRQFPETLIFPFKVRGNGNSFNENGTRDSGFSTWSQNLNFVVPKQDRDIDLQLEAITNGKHRAIVEYNNGVLRIAGLLNGLDCRVEITSGGNYAEFSGYRFSLTGMEAYNSEQIPSLDDSGFVVPDQDEEFNFIYEDSNNFVFEEPEKNFIFE